jgi:hypothetical protein
MDGLLRLGGFSHWGHLGPFKRKYVITPLLFKSGCNPIDQYSPRGQRHIDVIVDQSYLRKMQLTTFVRV